MAEPHDRESKTEEATEKKIRDAIAASFASLVGILIITGLFLSNNVIHIRLTLESFIDDPGGWSLESGADVVQLFQAIGLDCAKLLVPVIAILAVAGIGSSMLQNPPNLAFDRIQPDPSRLSIIAGWRRLFSARSQVEFLKAAFKFSVVGLVGFLLLQSARDDVLLSMFSEPGELPGLVRGLVMKLLSAMAVATVVLAAADLVWSRLFWQRDLRMTRQEVKDEVKQMEGDPILKGRLRSLARDRSRKRMIAAVPRATLVIANPTHFAVALRYVREEGGAPLVIAKGQDLIALKIREIAENCGIPVIEDKLLARSLYDAVEVDKLIPQEFYKAVAEIILFLMVRGGKGAPRTAKA
jgi:flagellar biosynthetic protein FlhB